MSGATKLMTAGGGGVNIQPASSIASDVTVNVPSQNCTLGIQGPAFSAYQSTLQSVANATWTKLQFQTKEFDTASCYDNTTNYRFTPNVAGYYQVNAAVAIVGVTTSISALFLYKNGSGAKQGGFFQGNGTYGSLATISTLIYLNGSTDYIEMYVFQGQGSAQNTAASTNTCFQAALVRAA